MELTKTPAKKTKPKTPAKAVKKLVKKVLANKPAKPVKIPIEEAELGSMSDEEILTTYAKEIEEHADWIWREQNRVGPTYSRARCMKITMSAIRNDNWPFV